MVFRPIKKNKRDTYPNAPVGKTSVWAAKVSAIFASE